MLVMMMAFVLSSATESQALLPSRYLERNSSFLGRMWCHDPHNDCGRDMQLLGSFIRNHSR